MSFPPRSSRKAHYLLFVGAMVLGAACSETASEDPVEGDCWPIDTAVAGQGSIEVGSGYGDFASFQDGQEVNVEAGGQGGYHIRIAARIEGLEPGVAEDIRSAQNPRTRFNLVDKNGDLITNASCPVRIPYGDKGDGLELLRPYSLVFPLDPEVRNRYHNERITVRAEIIDADGNFAISEYSMTARFPEPPPTIGSNISISHDVMAPTLYE